MSDKVKERIERMSTEELLVLRDTTRGADHQIVLQELRERGELRTVSRNQLSLFSQPKKS